MNESYLEIKVKSKYTKIINRKMSVPIKDSDFEAKSYWYETKKMGPILVIDQNTVVVGIELEDRLENFPIEENKMFIIEVWNIKNSNRILTINDCHTDKISDIQLIYQNTIVSSSYDGYIKIWNLKTLECISNFYLESHVFQVIDKNRIAVYLNNCINIFNINTSQCISTIDFYLTGLEISRNILQLIDNKTLAAFSLGKEHFIFKFWNISSLQSNLTITGDDEGYEDVKAINHNKIIAANSTVIDVWDTESTRRILSIALENTEYFLEAIEIINQNTIIILYDRGVVRIWDIEQGSCISNIEPEIFKIGCDFFIEKHLASCIKLISYSDKKSLVMACDDGFITTMNIQTPKSLKFLAYESLSLENFIEYKTFIDKIFQ